MVELSLSNEIREYLKQCQGKEVTLQEMVVYFKIEPGSNDYKKLKWHMSQTMVDEKRVSSSGRKDGVYKVIRQVKPVSIFGRERRPPITIKFPIDFDKGMPMDFAEHLILREGDMILIAGRSNFGKTALCMNFLAENIDTHPVLMGNEYTTVDDEPNSRFLNRLDKMEWVEWANGTGDKFTLLPVREDYAEHIVKDQINIIDWINLDEHYQISRIMEGIKRQLGKGVAIIAIQKSEGVDSGRGGQFTKDFSDLEILLDSYGESEVMLKLGKVKESSARLTGKVYAFFLQGGVKIQNFRELKLCPSCYGKKWRKSGNTNIPCNDCNKTGYTDA